MKWVITDKAQIQHNITWKVLVGPDLCKEFQGRVDVFYAVMQRTFTQMNSNVHHEYLSSDF